MHERPWFALGWRCGQLSGWGQFGTHFARTLAAAGYRVMLLAPPESAGVLPMDRPLLRSLFDPQKHRAPFESEPGWVCVQLGNDVPPPPRGLAKHGKVAGIIFCEDSGSVDAAKLNAYDVIVAGSRWTERVLKAKGVKRVVMAHQGYDGRVFFPRDCAPASSPATTPHGETPLYVFSGGKLEFRKGQDIAIEAFKRFRQTPEGRNAVLVCAWDNRWPSTMAGVPLSGYVRGLPSMSQGNLDIGAWLTANGLPDGSFIDCGRLSPPQLAQVLRSCTVGIFPNRAESGTNLVLVEALASGLPCIASTGHGHDDVIESGIHSDQAIPSGCRLYRSADGWTEVGPDALVAVLRDSTKWAAPRPMVDYWDWAVRGPAIAEAIIAGGESSA